MTEKIPEKRAPEEIDLQEVAIVLLKRKKLIAGLTLVCCVLSVVVALLLPPIYRAETSILPPQQSSSSMLGQLMGQLGGLSGVAGAAVGIKNPNELYVGMLQSRTVVDRIIDRFDLMKSYDEEYRENARKKLLKYTEVQSDRKSGIITVAVEGKDPRRAADMANAFVEELRALTGGIAMTEAGQRRLFFEGQLKEAKSEVSRAEEGFRGFQERTGALQIDAQAKAVIEGIANLRAMIAARAVQLKVLQTFATSRNPDFQKVEEEVRALKTELSRLEGAEGKGPDPLMPTGRIPAVGTEYLRKLRDLKYAETLYEQLAKQYELARIDEARDAAVIQVIDPAIPPERKGSAEADAIVLPSTAVSFLIAVILCFLLESAGKSATDPETSRKWDALRRSVL